jgi:acyl-coenzyme A synthetase/AMP-(fatty) acid ligase
VISTHPSAAEVVVVGLPDAMKGETVKPFVVLRPGTTASDVEHTSLGRDRLASYKVPAQIEIVTELPTTQMGKLVRRTLKERELTNTSATRHEPNATAWEACDVCGDRRRVRNCKPNVKADSP